MTVGSTKLSKPVIFEHKNSSTAHHQLVKNTWNLLNSEQEVCIKLSDFEWHLNLGLLMQVYQQTENQKLKTKISFLALQYLAKASPINLFDVSPSGMSHELYQLGFFQNSATYHRSSSVFEKYLADSIKQIFVPSSLNIFVLTDTIEFESFLPLYFTVVSLHDQSSWSTIISKALSDYVEKGETFYHFIKPPLLFDFTPYLSECIQSNEEMFNQKMSSLEAAIDTAIAQAIESFEHKTPLLKDKLKAFVRDNITAICRCEKYGVGIVKILPLFHKPEFRKDKKALRQAIEARRHFLNTFVNLTGLRLSAVEARKKVFHFLDLPTLLKLHSQIAMGCQREVSYVPENLEKTLYYPKKLDFIQTNLFRTFEKYVVDYSAAFVMCPERALLIKATVAILKGLLNDIPDTKWKELNDDPEQCQLLQTTLERTAHHLANVSHRLDDFSKFTTAVELIYSEIASLLILASPFSRNDFEGIFKAQLTHIPESLRPYLKVGVGKSAMHVLSGILATKENAQLAMIPGVYHEQIALIGEENTFEKVLSNASIKKVDVYVGEFNPNINKDPAHTFYHARNPIADITKLLEAKSETDRLTQVQKHSGYSFKHNLLLFMRL